VIKCHNNLLKQGLGQFALRSINLLILFGVEGVDHCTPTYKKGEKKQIVVIIETYHLCQLRTKL
jgi:hypothetical protein